MQAAGKRWITFQSVKDVFELVVFADTHELDKGFVEEKLNADIARVAADDHAFWIHLGDYGNFKSFRHPTHFDPTQYADDVMVADLGDQAAAINKRMERYKPIAHKCLGILMGNHEAAFQRNTEQWEMHSDICKHLAVPNLGYCCFADIVFTFRCGKWALPYGILHKSSPPSYPCNGGGRGPNNYKRDGSLGRRGQWNLRLFAHHGTGASQTASGRVKKLSDAMDRFDADVYLLAHLHNEAVYKRVTLTASPSCKEIRERLQLGAITGSYLKTYTESPDPSYGERNMYRAACLGAVSVFFQPAYHKMWIPTVAEAA